MYVWQTLVAAALVPLAAAGQTFEDRAPIWGIAGTAGAAGNGIGGGVAWFDADGDGALDLATTGPANQPRLFLMKGGKPAEQPLALAPLTPPAYAGGLVPFDMDGDGDQDVLLLRVGPNVLFRNDGAGGFTDVSDTHLPGAVRWSTSAAVGDVDGDGDDDLLVANYIGDIEFPVHRCEPNTLLLNDGQGRFTDASPAFGLTSRGCTLAVAFSDYDNDGDLDVLEINDFGPFAGPNVLYRNDGPTAGGWAFTDVSTESGFDLRLYGMGVGTGDVNDDGWLDYYVTSIGRQALLMGGPGGGFLEAADEYGLAMTLANVGYQMGWAAVFEDLDADGWLDLYVAAGYISATSWLTNDKVAPNLLFAGTPNPPWESDSPAWSLVDPPENRARGISVGDYDADGRPDLAVGHANGLLSVYRNTSTGPLPLRIRLLPALTGPSATGARITGECAGLTRSRELTGGGTFASRHDPVVRLTFPPSCAAAGGEVALRVRWPSGYVQALEAGEGDALALTEPTWFEIHGAELTVSPTDALGKPLSSEASVVVTAEGGDVGPLTHAGGSWTGSWSPADGVTSVRFTVQVDGQPLPARPVVHPAAFADVLTRPQHVISKRSWDLLVVPRAAGGAPVGPGHAVVAHLHGKPAPASDLGDGSYRVEGLDAPGPGDVAVTVSVDGEPLSGSWSVAVQPRWALSESHLELSRPVFAASKHGVEPFFLRLQTLDANGLGVDPSTLGPELHVNGDVLKPSQEVKYDDKVALSYHSGELSDGDSLQVYVDGEPLGPTETFRVVHDSETTAEHVSPERSQCGASMAWMHADGEDQLTVTVFLRDAAGHALPVWPEDLELVSDGSLTPLPETLTSNSVKYEIDVRAGTTPGVGVIGVLLAGQPTGVTCDLTLLPAKPAPPLSPQHSELEVIPASLPIGNAEAFVRLAPRLDNGRLAGSGLALALATDLGELIEPLTYSGIGRYDAILRAGTTPGIATLTATTAAGEVLLTAEVEFFDPKAPVEPDADAGTLPDAGEVDAGGSADVPDVVEPSAAEPSKDVAEPEADAEEPADVPAADDVDGSFDVDVTPIDETEPTPHPDVGLPPEVEPPGAPEPNADAGSMSPGGDPGAAADTRSGPDAVPSPPPAPAPPDGGCQASPAAPATVPLAVLAWLLLTLLLRRLPPPAGSATMRSGGERCRARSTASRSTCQPRSSTS